MNLFLPIAEASVSVPLVVGVGGAVGLLSGLFGVGGGWLITPVLMVLGISPMVAASSGSAAIVAASLTGTIQHSRNGTVDFRMGFVLFAGAVVGSFAGVELLHWLNRLGHGNLAIRLLYVVLLACLGALMLAQSIGPLRRPASGTRSIRPRRRTWLDALPGHVRFPRSDIEVSILAPIALGLLTGTLAALMGVGGGFVMVPLMLYVLRMRMHVVAGTSLFQILLTCIVVTILQAAENHTVDLLLAVLLSVGSAVGALVGARWGRRLGADRLVSLLAIIVLAVACKVTLDLVRVPEVLLTHAVGG